jgi:protein O-mannosyl-transferase
MFFLRKKKLSINFRDYRLYMVIAGLTALMVFVMSNFSFSIFDPILPEQGHTYTVTPLNYLLTQFSVIVKYIQLLILPIHQNLDYDYVISNSFFEVRTLLCFILLLGLIILAIFLYKKNRLLSFGIFWFFLTLSVEASFIPIPNVIFEHRTYLPSFGFFLVLSSLAYLVFRGKYQYLATGILVVIIFSNSFLTFQRNKVWKDEFTLCNDNVKKAPNSARAVSSRGDIYAERGQYENALADYTKAITINPNFKEVYTNRGIVYLVLQQWDNAIADLSKAISIDPDYAKAYSNRGIAYGNLMKWDKALADFSQEIRIMPELPKGYYNRGNAYCNLGLWEKAIADYSKTIELGNTDKRAYVYRGIAFANLLQWDKALADYNKALEIDPGYEPALSQREIANANINTAEKK